jgi:hypothetical protein
VNFDVRHGVFICCPYADAGYAGQQDMIHELAPEAKAFVNERPYGGKKLTLRQKERNRNKSRIRARVEQAFGVIKGVSSSFVACALANLFMARGHLLRTQWESSVQNKRGRTVRNAMKSTEFERRTMNFLAWRNSD